MQDDFKHSQAQEVSPQFLILVIGVNNNDTASAQSHRGPDHIEVTRLIGIATNFEQARRLVGKDFLSICTEGDLDPIASIPVRMEGNEGFCMQDHTWHFISIQPNTLENFTL